MVEHSQTVLWFVLFSSIICTTRGTACQVTNWGKWGQCTGTCQFAMRVRNRDVRQPAFPELASAGGVLLMEPCPPLYQVQQCSPERCLDGRNFTDSIDGETLRKPTPFENDQEQRGRPINGDDAQPPLYEIVRTTASVNLQSTASPKSENSPVYRKNGEIVTAKSAFRPLAVLESDKELVHLSRQLLTVQPSHDRNNAPEQILSLEYEDALLTPPPATVHPRQQYTSTAVSSASPPTTVHPRQQYTSTTVLSEAPPATVQTKTTTQSPHGRELWAAPSWRSIPDSSQINIDAEIPKPQSSQAILDGQSDIGNEAPDDDEYFPVPIVFPTRPPALSNLQPAQLAIFDNLKLDDASNDSDSNPKANLSSLSSAQSPKLHLVAPPPANWTPGDDVEVVYEYTEYKDYGSGDNGEPLPSNNSTSLLQKWVAAIDEPTQFQETNGTSAPSTGSWTTAVEPGAATNSSSNPSQQLAEVELPALPAWNYQENVVEEQSILGDNKDGPPTVLPSVSAAEASNLTKITADSAIGVTPDYAILARTELPPTQEGYVSEDDTLITVPPIIEIGDTDQPEASSLELEGANPIDKTLLNPNQEAQLSNQDERNQLVLPVIKPFADTEAKVVTIAVPDDIDDGSGWTVNASNSTNGNITKPTTGFLSTASSSSRLNTTTRNSSIGTTSTITGTTEAQEASIVVVTEQSGYGSQAELDSSGTSPSGRGSQDFGPDTSTLDSVSSSTSQNSSTTPSPATITRGQVTLIDATTSWRSSSIPVSSTASSLSPLFTEFTSPSPFILTESEQPSAFSTLEPFGKPIESPESQTPSNNVPIYGASETPLVTASGGTGIQSLASSQPVTEAVAQSYSPPSYPFVQGLYTQSPSTDEPVNASVSLSSKTVPTLSSIAQTPYLSEINSIRPSRNFSASPSITVPPSGRVPATITKRPSNASTASAASSITASAASTRRAGSNSTAPVSTAHRAPSSLPPPARPASTPTPKPVRRTTGSAARLTLPSREASTVSQSILYEETSSQNTPTAQTQATISRRQDLPAVTDQLHRPCGDTFGNKRCCRLPAQARCPNGRLAQQVLRWYRLAGTDQCTSYSYGYCGFDLEAIDQPIKFEEECYDICYTDHEKRSLPVFDQLALRKSVLLPIGG